MYSRKFKTVFSFVLTFALLFSSCFLNLTFAIDTNGGEENITSGLYYIKSYEDNMCIGAVDHYSASLSSTTGIVQQRWELIYVSNGYYNIRNAYNGKYLTAPANNYDGSYVELNSLSASYEARQLWTFIPVYNGSETYYIQSKSQENSDMVLKGNETLGSYGYDLIQSTDVYGYYAEWLFKKINTATIIGINYNNSYISAINTAGDDFSNAGYISTALTPSSITPDSIKSYLQNSNVFILRSTGGSDGTGTYMWLNNTNILPYIHSWEIYHYNANTCLDMSGCDVAVFAGCYTSNHSSQSLPQSAVNAGSEFGIGFSEDPNTEEFNKWVESFSLGYSTHENTLRAANDAILYAGDGYAINSMDIFTQGG